MKRAAENQLTKDSAEDDEIEMSGSGEFKKADEATLARRPIKALPKRGSAPFTTPSAQPSFGQTGASMNGEKQPQGGSFGGFGTNSSSAFTFSTPPSVTASGSGSTGTSATPKTFSFNPLPPSSSGSSAASIFGSIVDNASKINGASGTTVPKSHKMDEDMNDDAAVTYYSSLRGLNVSLNDAIAKALQDDPFFDASGMLETYKTLRQNIENDFEPHRTKDAPAPSNGPSSSSSIFGTPAAPPSLPVPPKGASFSFGQPSSTNAPSTNSQGFKPSGFTPSFFSTPPAGKSATASPFSSSASTSTAKPFSFSSTTSIEGASKNDNATSVSSGFSFGSGSGSKPPSLFGSATPSVFGASSSAGEKKTEGSAPTTFVFGSSASTPMSSSPFTFGKAPTSSSVGFTFGTPTPEPEGTSTPGLSASGSSSALLDTAKAASSMGDSRGATPATTDGGDAEDTPKVLGANPNDEEGAGEEDEETMHASRVKVYKMTQQDGKPAWTEYGIGMVRLKKHKETGSRRMLCRNSATAKIMINFRLYKTIKVSLTKQSISFIGHEDGKPASFRLRLKDETSANALKEAIEAQVADMP